MTVENVFPISTSMYGVLSNRVVEALIHLFT